MAKENPEDNRVASFLSRNATFAQSYKPGPSFTDFMTRVYRRIVIVTCFDGRADPRDFFDLQPGEAVLLKNAGGRVNGDALRSLIVLDSLLRVGTVIVVHHTDCGLTHTSDESIRARLKDRAPEKAQEIDGMEFQAFRDMHQSVRHDMDVLKASPYLDIQVLGYVYDVAHGTVEEVKA